MRLSETVTHLVIGLTFLLFALVVYFVLLPAGVRSVSGYGLSPRMFPTLATGAMAVFAVIFLVRAYALRGVGGVAVQAPLAHIARVGAVVLFLGGYIALIDRLGFYSTTVLAIAGLTLFEGQRKWWVVLLLSLGSTAFMYLLFAILFKVYMPSGLYL